MVNTILLRIRGVSGVWVHKFRIEDIVSLGHSFEFVSEDTLKDTLKK